MSNEPTPHGSSVTDTPAGLLNSIRSGIEQELTHQYERQWAERTREADRRTAQSLLEVREEQGAQLAVSRRGHWYQLGAMAGSATVGFWAGWHAQKRGHLGVLPGLTIGTVPVILGLNLDESVTTRASLVLGGVMFALGATVAPTESEGSTP